VFWIEHVLGWSGGQLQLLLGARLYVNVVVVVVVVLII
jgi:hypothetical protein